MSLRMAVARAVLRARKRRNARASFEERQRRNLPDPPDAVARAHRCEPFETGGARAIWLDRHLASEGVLLYLHGGSYNAGPLPDQWGWFSAICTGTGMAGVLADYRLAPQHPFPAALDDAGAVASDLRRRDGADAAPWFLLGDSAGGGLALALAFTLRDSGAPLPAAMVLVSPWLDLALADESARREARIDPMLSLQSLDRAAGAYAGDHNPHDPLLSPLNGDPAGLPPMLVHGGDRELFVWDMRAWRERCLEAGTEITYVEQPGGFHDYPLAVRWIPEARTALAEQAGFLLERR